MRHQLFSMAAGVALLLTAGSVTVHAQQQGENNQNQQGDNNQNQQNDNDGNVNLKATPELDSLALFGTGAAGMVGYGLMRLRAGRRKDTTVTD